MNEVYLKTAISYLLNRDKDILEAINKTSIKIDISIFSKLDAAENLLLHSKNSTDIQTKKSLVLSSLTKIEEAISYFGRLSSLDVKLSIKEQFLYFFPTAINFFSFGLLSESNLDKHLELCLKKSLYINALSKSVILKILCLRYLNIPCDIKKDVDIIIKNYNEVLLSDEYLNFFISHYIAIEGDQKFYQLMDYFLKRQRKNTKDRVFVLKDAVLFSSDKEKIKALLEILLSTFNILKKENILKNM